jgi:hypothetical protein
MRVAEHVWTDGVLVPIFQALIAKLVRERLDDCGHFGDVFGVV